MRVLGEPKDLEKENVGDLTFPNFVKIDHISLGLFFLVFLFI